MTKNMILLLSLYTFCVALLSVSAAPNKNNAGPVTCGSVVKLQHKETGGNLHSHAIAWGSGSGQQSVTSNKAANDRGSLWIIKEGWGKDVCEVGMPIKCGDVIRFEHAATGKNLHSHLFRAPLSGNQEVSGFGDGGNGDTGDNWEILCEPRETVWNRYKPITFQHVDTKKFLSTSESFKFNQQNCGGNCPIMDQTEVSAAGKRDVFAKWVADQGVYFPSKSDKQPTDEDDEL